jgi:hypothetical protein
MLWEFFLPANLCPPTSLRPEVELPAPPSPNLPHRLPTPMKRTGIVRIALAYQVPRTEHRGAANRPLAASGPDRATLTRALLARRIGVPARTVPDSKPALGTPGQPASWSLPGFSPIAHPDDSAVSHPEQTILTSHGCANR